MLIERTIRIDGQKVTITQSVDTGTGNGLSSETTVAANEELALAVGLGATHNAPLEILRSATPASGGQQERPGDAGQQERPGDGGQQERPGDGGQQERPGDGGQQERPGDGGGVFGAGVCVIFGPITVNCAPTPASMSESNADEESTPSGSL